MNDLKNFLGINKKGIELLTTKNAYEACKGSILEKATLDNLKTLYDEEILNNITVMDDVTFTKYITDNYKLDKNEKILEFKTKIEEILKAEDILSN